MSSLGEGSFSRVFECVDQQDPKENLVAVKVVRNDKGCLDAGLGEIRVLARLQQLHDADTSPPYARLLNYFYYKEHLHIVLELLGSSLLRFNQAMGGEPSEYYNPNRLAFLSFQLLTGLKLMHRAKLIHCDVKPDNVCFASISRCTVKMIDFGACMCENDTLNSYVQSRWYRAPEVMLGIPYDEKIDIWSLGCLLAEMLLGYPIFHGASVPRVLASQHAVLGPYPAEQRSKMPDTIAKAYFSGDGSLYEVDPPGKSPGVHYVRPVSTTLSEILPTNDQLLIDFISSLLNFDPVARPSAEQALQHPFITVNMSLRQSESNSSTPPSDNAIPGSSPGFLLARPAWAVPATESLWGRETRHT
jgi:serine/threonine protein kinase